MPPPPNPPTSCAHCGANLGPADLQRPACPYCGTVHPHVAAAAQKVEVIKQLLAAGPGGVPAPFSGVPGPVPPPMGFPIGSPPMGYPMGPPPIGYPAGSPPMMGGPVGGATPYMQDPYRAQRVGGNMVLVAVVVVVLFVFAGAAAAVFLLMW